MVARTTLLLLGVFTFLFNIADANQEENIIRAFNYLARYGYVGYAQTNNQDYGNNRAPDNGINEKDFNKALIDFQRFNGLNMTGELDEQTVKLMNTPRCGNRDIVRYNSPLRFSVFGRQFKWRQSRITYRISKYSRRSGLSQQQIRSQVAEAFRIWEDVTHLRFQRVERWANIEIRFDQIIDGKDNVLARTHTLGWHTEIIHARMSMDDGEPWAASYEWGKKDILPTLVHEIGHALGLDHSQNSNAIMYAYSSGQHNWKQPLQLHWDDIDGIQYLY